MKKSWMFLILAAFFAVSCSNDENDDKIVSDITIDPSETLVSTYGETLQSIVMPTLKVVFANTEGSNVTVTWSSSNTALITVDSSTGKLTLKKLEDGKATITATTSEGKSAKSEITVSTLIDGKYGVIDISNETGLLILDRNLGATEVFNGNATTPNKASFGNYYQWCKNIVVATSEGANDKFNKEWKAEGSDYSDWSIADKTPCPKGWRIPNKDEMQVLVDAMYVVQFPDMEWDQTQEEEDAANAFYAKLLLPRNAFYKIVGNAAEDRNLATPEIVSNRVNLWTSSATTKTPNVSDRGFKMACALEYNLFSNLTKTLECNVAMPIRCIKGSLIQE